jgi:hypothetical protein
VRSKNIRVAEPHDQELNLENPFIFGGKNPLKKLRDLWLWFRRGPWRFGI